MSADDPIAAHNARAWDREAAAGNPATVPVDAEGLKAAAAGDLALTLTGRRQVPAEWLEELKGARVLCLALGGGQQVPLLAAAGARVTAIDNSPVQVARDVETLAAAGLEAEVRVGDMRDLSHVADGSFDRVVVGLGTQFIPDVAPVWREAHRVLKPGGALIAAIVNPMTYALDWLDYQAGIMRIAHPLPYSDLKSLTAEERAARFDPADPLEFSHTLKGQIGGMLTSGLLLKGFLEDVDERELSGGYFPSYFLILAVKPQAV